MRGRGVRARVPSRGVRQTCSRIPSGALTQAPGALPFCRANEGGMSASGAPHFPSSLASAARLILGWCVPFCLGPRAAVARGFASSGAAGRVRSASSWERRWGSVSTAVGTDASAPARADRRRGGRLRCPAGPTQTHGALHAIRNSRSAFPDQKTHAADGVNELRASFGVDFLSHSRDVYIDDVVERCASEGSFHTSRVSIYTRYESLLHAASGSSSKSNSRAVRSIVSPPRAARRETRSISRSATRSRSVSAGPPRRINARRRASKLGEREWLDEIIVSAAVEADDAVLNRVLGPSAPRTGVR